MASVYSVFRDEWATGDRAKAKELAVAYVAENNEALANDYGPMTRDELVGLMGVMRSDGKINSCTRLEMWLPATYKPQKITGTIAIGAPAEGTE